MLRRGRSTSTLGVRSGRPTVIRGFTEVLCACSHGNLTEVSLLPLAAISIESPISDAQSQEMEQHFRSVICLRFMKPRRKMVLLFAIGHDDYRRVASDVGATSHLVASHYSSTPSFRP